MSNSILRYPEPRNEPVLDYRSGSPETAALKKEIERQLGSEVEIPVVIGGREVRTGKTDACRAPHRHQTKLGVYHQAGADEAKAAVESALKAHRDWSEWKPHDRAAIFLKAAELLATKYRPILNAATMLGQSKTCHQAEIDAACELVDFFRFNVKFMQDLYEVQPLSTSAVWNRLEYRPLEGFVFAVTPFNFTSIAGNLPTSAALMGNVAIWKPASSSVYSGWFLYKLLEEAGLPPGVIQFLPGSGRALGEVLLKDPNLGGIHFTGGTSTFNQMWRTVGENLERYKGYPRIVGETGGKDFVFAHPSADVEALCTALIRGAFEYQGQKCSAASRAYLPKSLWPKVRERLAAEVSKIAMGDVTDWRNFMGAVIDKASFENIKGYLDFAKSSSEAELIAGGKANDKEGWFVEPTVIHTTNPKFKTMVEEIFGPVLTVYVYDDKNFEETLKLCDETSPYALTGCIWAQDRKAVERATSVLRYSAGNFYINNKPTGAVVGQQPFGGARASGTNDKAGSVWNLVRWVNTRTISETFVPPTEYRYPFMT